MGQGTSKVSPGSNTNKSSKSKSIRTRRNGHSAVRNYLPTTENPIYKPPANRTARVHPLNDTNDNLTTSPTTATATTATTATTNKSKGVFSLFRSSKVAANTLKAAKQAANQTERSKKAASKNAANASRNVRAARRAAEKAAEAERYAKAAAKAAKNAKNSEEREKAAKAAAAAEAAAAAAAAAEEVKRDAEEKRAKKEAEAARIAEEAAEALRALRRAEEEKKAAKAAQAAEDEKDMQFIRAEEAKRAAAKAAKAVPQKESLKNALQAAKNILKGVSINPAAVEAAANALAQGKAIPKPQERPGDRFLCDMEFNKKIKTTSAAIDEVYASRQRLGQGAFGYTTSAEVYMTPKGEGEPFHCIGALKISTLSSDDVPTDVVTEISTYARLSDKPCLAKGLYIKLRPKELKTVMEHYLSDLDNLGQFVHASLENNPGKYPIIEFLTRGIMYQVLVGLKEMHAANMIHHDLKPANMLLAHDGMVYITDYGLSLHNPFGFQYPQDFYYKDTTPTIQPPESLFNNEGFNDRYDIWSAGCSMEYFLLNKMSFDMWITDDNWRRTVNKDNYKQRINRILSSLKGKVSEPCIAFITKLLQFDPSKRPSADQALKDPWFNGVGLGKAQEYVNRYAGQFIQEKHTEIKDKSKRKGNANAIKNIEGASYIRIEQAAPWKPSLGGIWKLRLIGKLFRNTCIKYDIDITIYLHAVELFDRYINAQNLERQYFYRIKEEDYTKLERVIYGCIIIAVKLSQLSKYRFNSIDLSEATKINKNDLDDTERDIIKILGGDLFIQENGFAEKFVNEIILPSGKIEDKVIRTVFALMLYGLSESRDDNINSIVSNSNEILSIYKSRRGTTAQLDAIKRIFNQPIIRLYIENFISSIYQYDLSYLLGTPHRASSTDKSKIIELSIQGLEYRTRKPRNAGSRHNLA